MIDSNVDLSMQFEQHELAIILVGLPLTLWFLVGAPGVGSQLGIAISLLWFGVGASVMRLHRDTLKS
jgi:hypothetical protein